MTEITHTPAPNHHNCYEIKSDNIDELINECISRIRITSRDFYRAELRKDLTEKGKSLIDMHAGNKNFYTVILTS